MKNPKEIRVIRPTPLHRAYRVAKMNKRSTRNIMTANRILCMSMKFFQYIRENDQRIQSHTTADSAFPVFLIFHFGKMNFTSTVA